MDYNETKIIIRETTYFDASFFVILFLVKFLIGTVVVFCYASLIRSFIHAPYLFNFPRFVLLNRLFCHIQIKRGCRLKRGAFFPAFPPFLLMYFCLLAIHFNFFYSSKNPKSDEFYLFQKCQLVSFEAPKLLNVRWGSCNICFGYFYLYLNTVFILLLISK